ncbi:helix-turn-helix domain containing protein [Prosthecochloris sp. SCSIO W1101]|uniref:helix-turn-helix domain-containing protein n=1 Tax=Prosthecochloris sp. SCSIO W1101 TaxID=2992242 RepID=UPI00223D4FE0|nr:helix-turn-helix domain-containing protein [Prosthecochloris sp. SCSIO W1101]UZJ42189.1 helix-turn-helix domain containing protein [Prosthecochloris sp. SCSIO W1101]
MDNEILLQRLKEVFKVYKDEELAEKLGLKKTTYSTWKTGGSRPNYELIFDKIEHLSINLHWLLTGEGDMHGKNARAKTEVERAGEHFAEGLKILLSMKSE